MLKNIFVGNLIVLILAVFLLFFAIRNNTFKKNIVKGFLWGISCILLLSISMIFYYYAVYVVEGTSIYIIASLQSLCRICCIATVIVFNYFINSKVNKEKYYFTSFFIYFFVEAGNVIFASHQVFDVNDLDYHNRIMSFLFIIIYLDYSINFIINSHRINKFKKEGGITASWCLSIFNSIGFSVEIFFKTYFIVPLCLIISLVYFYIYLQTIHFKYDNVTGLYNKNSFYSQIMNYEHRKYTFAIVDMDGLKFANDLKGHQYGDVCINKIAEELKNEFDVSSKIYRWGGDEFFILSSKLDELDFKNKIEKVSSQLSKNHINISYGISTSDEGKNYDDVINIADKKCYKMKQYHKEDSVL